MINETILNRIRQLLTLANNSGATIAESASAFAQAQRLLTKHNLDLMQLELATGVKKESETISDSSEPLYSGGKVILWKSNLASGLCKLNSCQMYIAHSYVGDEKQIAYKIVGRVSDIAVIKYFFNSIVSQIEILCAEATKNNLGRGKTFTNNFKHGATQVVLERLNTVNQEIRSEYTNTAIVLVDNKAAAVEEWIKANLRLVTKPSHSTTSDVTGYNLGRKAGGRVALSKGLDGAQNGVKLQE